MLKPSFIKLLLAMLFASGAANGQSKYITIPLPIALRSINEEYSGMAQMGGRVYILPQYGSYKETRLDGVFNIYSFRADSINRVITGKDTALIAFDVLKVCNLEKLPAFIKQTYQGFETLTFINNTVYMAIETVDTAANCYVVKGTVDTIKKHITIDHQNYLALKRPYYISNAGFESITWLPQINKLIAFYEFNAHPDSNKAYLLDTSLTVPPQTVNTPLLYFRNTDATTAPNGRIYAINYFWDGEYDKYLNNGIAHSATKKIKRAVPTLKNNLTQFPDYLKSHTFARIVYLKNYRSKAWKEVAVFEGFRNNWEGITLFNKGALIITDANRSAKQVTILAYVEF